MCRKIIPVLKSEIITYLSLVFLFFVILTAGSKARELTGSFFERVDAPPWAMSILSPDTGDVYFPTIKFEDIDSVELYAIRDFSRFAPDGKGPNYLRVDGNINKDGTFSIDISQFKDNDLIKVVAIINGYINLWDGFRFCEKCNYKNMKIIFVKIRRKPYNQKSKE